MKMPVLNESLLMMMATMATNQDVCMSCKVLQLC